MGRAVAREGAVCAMHRRWGRACWMMVLRWPRSARRQMVSTADVVIVISKQMVVVG